MKAEEKTLFGQLLSGTAELYSKKLSPELLEIYWRALDQYSLADVSHALNLHVLNPDSGQFMPKPADIVRYVHGDTRVQALQAWSKVTSAIRSVGAYESIVFDDPIIHVVIHEMNGWVRLCHVKEDQLSFMGSEFEKRYAAHILQKPKVYPNKLMGHFNNYPYFGSDSATAEPRYFGDQELAKQVYLSGTDFTINTQHDEPTLLNKIKELTHA